MLNYKKSKKKTKKIKKHKSKNNKTSSSKSNNRPTENPKDFPLNKFKSKKNNLYRVSLRNNKKVWRKASKKETKCYKYLQNKISYNLDEYKKGKYKTSKQAIAISYSQAKLKYPDCNL